MQRGVDGDGARGRDRELPRGARSPGGRYERWPRSPPAARPHRPKGAAEVQAAAKAVLAPLVEQGGKAAANSVTTTVKCAVVNAAKPRGSAGDGQVVEKRGSDPFASRSPVGGRPRSRARPSGAAPSRRVRSRPPRATGARSCPSKRGSVLPASAAASPPAWWCSAPEASSWREYPCSPMRIPPEPRRPGDARRARGRVQRRRVLRAGGARALRPQPHRGAGRLRAPHLRRARSPRRRGPISPSGPGAAGDRGGARHLRLDGRGEDRRGQAQLREAHPGHARRRRDRLRALRQRHRAGAAAGACRAGARGVDRAHRAAPIQSGGTNIPPALPAAVVAALEGAGRGRSAARGCWRATGSTPTARSPSSTRRAAPGEGVTVSSMGIGLDFGEGYIGGVARAGHGNFGFVKDGASLAAFLHRRLEETATTTIEGVTRAGALARGRAPRPGHGRRRPAARLGRDRADRGVALRR